jgi:catechol 2,3-dioxygenase
MSASLHPDTMIGMVSLTVHDLIRSLHFYQEILGFSLHEREGSVARLGAGGPDLLELVEMRDGRRVQSTTGLYHYAILVPSRYQLALSLKRILETNTPVQGFADHLVSEAIYLADPDGNGIEIYRDRPRADWPRVDGQIRMATDPLDLDALLAQLNGDRPSWAGLPPETIIGHMHLHVREIAEAEHFYRQVIGFDLVLRYGPSASFLSVGGYHHHLGVNTWAGVGAPPPPQDALGMRWYEIRLPNGDQLQALLDRLGQAGGCFEEMEGSTFLRDPSANGIRLSTP